MVKCSGVIKEESLRYVSPLGSQQGSYQLCIKGHIANLLYCTTFDISLTQLVNSFLKNLTVIRSFFEAKLSFNILHNN